MRADHPFESIVVFAEHADDDFGLGVGREDGEIPKITEYHDHFDAPPIENALVTGAVNQFGHLRREKALEPVYVFRALL